MKHIYTYKVLRKRKCALNTLYLPETKRYTNIYELLLKLLYASILKHFHHHMKYFCQKRLLAHVHSLDSIKYRHISLFPGVLLVSDSMKSKAPCKWQFGEDDNFFSTREAGRVLRNTEIKNT